MIQRKILIFSIALCVFIGGASALPEESWREEITVTSGAFVQTVTFGTNESGSDGYDQGLDLLAPPPSPNPVVDVYFPVDNIVFNRLYGDIRYILNATNPERVWTLQILSKNEDALLAWNPATLPADIAFTMNAAVSDYDMKSNSSVSLAKSTAEISVTIRAEFSPTISPVANFTVNATSGTAPFTVQFTDTSTGDPTAWSWDFGDGNSSTEQHPVHTYRVPGTYTVNFTASTADGSDTLSRPGYITVTSVKGDFNYNGAVDIGDVSKVAYMVVGKAAADPAADFNANGAVDIGDAAKIAYYFVEKIPVL